jgi:hypothetical protein
MVTAMALDSSGSIYGGTYDHGIYRSTDNGVSWDQFNGGLLASRIREIVVTPSGHIIIGTYDNGFYRSIKPVIGEFAESTLALGQNYPNPVSSSTTIPFTLPSEGYYTIKVYSLIGQEIATLLDERRAGGDYTVAFNAEDLPEGSYLYQLRSPTSSAIRLMSVVHRKGK